MNDLVRRTIGELGEEIVRFYFPYAKPTDDWYDEKKDGTLGRYTYEVKVCTYNAKYKGLLTDQNHWWKLDNVDLIFFITVPSDRFHIFLVVTKSIVICSWI